jgi:hypothetical protein
VCSAARSATSRPPADLRQSKARIASGRLPAAVSVTRGATGNDRVARTAALPEMTKPMAEKESTSSMVSGLVQDFIAQLRAVTAGLEDMAGSGERRPLAPGAFALPGALSAAQLTSIASSVAAQRRSIEALKAQLKAQLSSFDEQLAVLEQILCPLAEWSRTWAGLEDQLLNMGGGSAAGSQASGS